MNGVLASRWNVLTARCEKLPVFWTVYALILAETVGEGVLAIPIAVAKIGPLAGVGVLIVIGIVNAITILNRPRRPRAMGRSDMVPPTWDALSMITWGGIGRWSLCLRSRRSRSWRSFRSM